MIEFNQKNKKTTPAPCFVSVCVLITSALKGADDLRGNVLLLLLDGKHVRIFVFSVTPHAPARWLCVCSLASLASNCLIGSIKKNVAARKIGAIGFPLPFSRACWHLQMVVTASDANSGTHIALMQGTQKINRPKWTCQR